VRPSPKPTRQAIDQTTAPTTAATHEQMKNTALAPTSTETDAGPRPCCRGRKIPLLFPEAARTRRFRP
jgi:hypothetical protein